MFLTFEKIQLPMRSLLISLWCLSSLFTHAQWTVINTNTSGPGSLRHALDSYSAGDTIRFDKAVLTNGNANFFSPVNYLITKSVHIIGVDSAGFRIIFNGINQHRAFRLNIPDTVPNRTVSFSNLVFKDMNSSNYSDKDGGAINVISLDTLTVDRCVFQNVDADGYGAAIGSENNGPGTVFTPDFVKISNSEFSGGTAYLGGVVFFHKFQKIEVENCEFYNNGSVNLQLELGDEVSIKNCYFHDNQMFFSSRGGTDSPSMYLSTLDRAEIDSCQFSDNITYHGCGQYRSIDSIFFNYCIFENNVATVEAPGITERAGSAHAFMRIFSCTFKDNQGVIAGGIQVANGLIQNCIVRGNSSSYGGAIRANSKSVGGDNLVRIEDCVLDSNTTTGRGGAITIYSDDFVLLRSTIAQNTSNDIGGAFYFGATGLTRYIASNTIVYNQADEGGAFYFDRGSATLRNNTIYANSATGNGSAFFMNRGYFDLKGNIISSNSGGQDVLAYPQAPSNFKISSLGYNITQPGFPIDRHYTDLTQFPDTAIGLAPLSYNGGFGQTMLPLDGSPAANSGDSTDHSLHQNLVPIFMHRDRGAAEGSAQSHYSFEEYTGCDSAFIYSQWYNSDSIISATFRNGLNSDSTHVITLSIQQSYRDSNVVHIDTCGPFTYLDGNTYYNDTSFIATLTSIHGCDSVVDVNMKITPIDDSVWVHWTDFIVTNTNATVEWYTCEDSVLVSVYHAYTAPDTAGYFAAISEDGCTAYTKCYNWSIGIDENTNSDVYLFPNPTQSTFRIDYPVEWGSIDLEIADMSGRLVFYEFNYSSNKTVTHHLASGTYVVRLFSDAGDLITKRLIVRLD